MSAPLTADRLGEIDRDLDNLVMPDLEDVRALVAEVREQRAENRKLGYAVGCIASIAEGVVQTAHRAVTA